MKKSQKKDKERVVFFLDILGFKNLVNSFDTKKKYIKTILAKLNDLKKYQYKGSSLKVTTFSDSAIVSFVYTECSGLYSKLEALFFLQKELLEMGILIRGACSMEKAIHTRNYVFGPAINKAYILENKCALYPRIIISEDIIEKCSSYSMHENYNDKKDILKLLKQDTDGFYYIDYIGYDTVDSHMDHNEDWGLYIKRVHDFIVNGLETNDASIKQKYLWLKDKYNTALKDDLVTKYQNEYSISLLKF